VGVCNKLRQFSVAVANFCNNNNKYHEFARVKVNNVSRTIERMRKMILATTLTTRLLLDQCHCHSRAYGVSNELNLKIDLIETKR
jgi:endonuclease IV